MDNSRTNCKAIILAAGLSTRWQASIKKDSTNPYFLSLFWEKINDRIRAFNREPNQTVRLDEITKGPNKENPIWHKSCAQLRDIKLIQYLIDSFMKCGIDEWVFVVTHNSKRKAQEDQIRSFIAEAKMRYNSAKIVTVPISGEFQLAHSVFRGLKNVYANGKDYQGNVVVAYSDIVWEQRLLQDLLGENDGDVVMLADSKWQDRNYPPRRIWHDKLYAEVVFLNQSDRIEKIGEAINRLEFQDRHTWYYGRQDDFKDVFTGCTAEIIGLFRFSAKGAKAFIREYERICREEAGKIKVLPWKAPEHLSAITAQERNVYLEKEALFGDFLEHLSLKNVVDIRPLVIGGGWAEIDHWGDIALAEEKIDQSELNLSRKQDPQRKPAKTEDTTKREEEGIIAPRTPEIIEKEGRIEPKPPEYLQHLLWYLNHGLRYWKLILIALIIPAILLCVKLGVPVKILRLFNNDSPSAIGRTQLYSRTQKRVQDAYERIEEEKLNPWSSINIGKMKPVTKHDGRDISYEGVLYAGTPRLIFWSDDFIPPLIEDAIVQVFDETIEECRKGNLEPKPYIDEANNLLRGFIWKVYNHMADMDQKLARQVDSSKTGRKDISPHTEKMERCLKGHYDAALLLASKKKSAN